MNSLKNRVIFLYEAKIIEDILELYEHKKFEKPYVPPTLQDAQTIENEAKLKLMIISKQCQSLIKWTWQSQTKKGKITMTSCLMT